MTKKRDKTMRHTYRTELAKIEREFVSNINLIKSAELKIINLGSEVRMLDLGLIELNRNKRKNRLFSRSDEKTIAKLKDVIWEKKASIDYLKYRKTSLQSRNDIIQDSIVILTKRLDSLDETKE
jgi:hypothetical protein